MKCVTPMVRYYIDYTLEEKLAIKAQDGKQFNRIIPRNVVLDNLDKDEDYYTHIQKKNDELIKEGSRFRFGLIPCKKCWACRLNYSSEWATRIMKECKYHEANYFITLTYNDEHLPKFDKISYKDKDGNVQTLEDDGNFKPTLNPRDLHKFINTLRKYFERQGHTGIKYYACGEYGTLGRPHYHIILMNCPLDINQFHDWHQDENYKMHWKSREIENAWSEGSGANKQKMGIIDIAFVEWADAAYVARYGTKLFMNGGTEEDYAKHGMVKEFTRCSSNPAIGLRYMQDNELDLLLTNKVIEKNFSDRPVEVPLPAYYMKKLEEKYPEYIDMIKRDRQEQAIRAEKLLKSVTSITDKKRYEQMAENILIKGKMLKRENLDIPWSDRVVKSSLPK